MLRVGFDPQTFLRQRTGGISRLFTDLIGAFDTDPSHGVEVDLPFTWVNNQYLPRTLTGRTVKQTPVWLPREVGYAPWALRGLPNFKDVDIVHHTYYSHRFLGNVRGALRACTVYDMIPEKFAGTGWSTGTHLAKLEYVRSCDLIICISESTRQDLYEIEGQVPGHVVVVPSAVGPGFEPGLPRLEALPHEYLLYVGGRKGYKDFSLLPDAVRRLKRLGIDIQVVVIGPEFTSEEQGRFASFGVTENFACLNADDVHLRQAYSNATLVIQTSRYEGFGMTPLEAMASGVPVVIADASSMPEVGGDVARYFEAGNAESLAEQTEQLLNDSATRRKLGAAGLSQAAKFSVSSMARRTAEAYREVIGLWR